jgi:hypothetical protein
MNSTRWNSLSEFVAHLGREKIAIVDETDKGWFIQWIDNSPRALARRVSITRYWHCIKDNMCTNAYDNDRRHRKRRRDPRPMMKSENNA